MKRILIIEDDPGIIEFLTLMLEMAGYKTDVALRDGKEMNQKIKENQPDLILLDMLLSGVDGRDIARKLKSQTSTRNIPITKPFQVDDLLFKVSDLVS
jgi:DNA-binding response OmpR family regulator